MGRRAHLALRRRGVRVASAPSRLALLAAIDPGRAAAVCRELTKRFEEVRRGTAAELATRFSEPVRGEVTLVLGPGVGDRPELHDAVRAVRELVDAGAARRSPRMPSPASSASRNELYRASLVISPD